MGNPGRTKTVGELMDGEKKNHNGHKIAAGFFGHRAPSKQDAVHENGNQAIIQKPSQQKMDGKQIARIFSGENSELKGRKNEQIR